MKKSSIAASSIFVTLYLWPLSFLIGSISISLSTIYVALAFVVIGIKLDDLVFFLKVIVVLILIGALQQLQNVEIINPARTYLGAPIIALTLTALRSSLLVINHDEKTILSIYRYGINLILTAQIIQAALWATGVYTPIYENYMLNLPRFSGPFAEPSHLALAAAPTILYLFLSGKKHFTKPDLTKLAFILLLSPSATLVAIIGICGIIYIWEAANATKHTQKIKAIVYSILILLLVLTLATTVDQFSSRVTDTIESIGDVTSISIQTNHSSVSFLKGFEVAGIALTEFPLGAGLLNMEYLNQFSTISSIDALFYDRNKNDGSSLFFKTVAEFGYIGVIFLVLFSRLFFFDVIRHKNYIVASILFGLIASAIRGTSYLDGAPLIALATYFSYSKSKSRKIVSHIAGGTNGAAFKP